MQDLLRPGDHREIETVVRWAIAKGKALEIVGHGTRRGIGRPAQYDATLDLSAHTGVTLYEPDELILSARAGTPVREIETLLASNGQELAFDPMDPGPLFGLRPRLGTIGGAIAANASGPRRIKTGAARDHFLGLQGVTGRGETIKAGGRVVKNVTGYDLCKLIAGSWGTLAVLTDVTIKVLPRPQTETTLLCFDLDDRRAAAAMAAALGGSSAVSAAAHLPEYIAAGFDGLTSARATTALRIDGVPNAIGHCVDEARRAVGAQQTFATLNAPESRLLWGSIRDVRPFWSSGDLGDRPLWRISTAPTAGCEIAAGFSLATQMFYDWGGGLMWVAPAAGTDCGAGEIRRAVASRAGYATLIRAPAAERATVDVFWPETGALAALTRRVKESFDPAGVLNPGRMWPGM